MSSALSGVWLFLLFRLTYSSSGRRPGDGVVRWIARRGTAIGERRGEQGRTEGGWSGSRRGVDDGESVYGMWGFDGVYNNRDSNSTTPRSLSLSSVPTILKKTTRSPRLLTQRTRTEPPSDRLTRDQRTAERSDEEEEEVKRRKRSTLPSSLSKFKQTTKQTNKNCPRSLRTSPKPPPLHSIPLVAQNTTHEITKPTKHRLSTYTWKRWSYYSLVWL
jgi:hypothetical protein